MIFIKHTCPHCNSSMVYEEWNEVRCMMCSRRIGKVVKHLNELPSQALLAGSEMQSRSPTQVLQVRPSVGLLRRL